MTKEELKAKFAEQQNIIENANNQIRSDMMEYIKSLPFKVGDKISCEWYDAGFISSICPETYHDKYTGNIDLRINLVKKDGTPSKRERKIWDDVFDSIKKID